MRGECRINDSGYGIFGKVFKNISESDIAIGARRESKAGTAREVRPAVGTYLRNLENDAGSGNFFGIRWIFFPDRDGVGLAAWRRGGDNGGWNEWRIV
jgi:hypothetical protein